MDVGYNVLQLFLKPEIRGSRPLTATCLVVHATANTSGAGARAHYNWLNSAEQHGWAHEYIDDKEIIQIVPLNNIAPATGPTFNRKAISFEMCEPWSGLTMAKQTIEFIEIWKRATWRAAAICYERGWTRKDIFSHAQVSKLHPDETDHTDPIGYFDRFGKTWSDFLDAVDVELRAMGKPSQPAFTDVPEDTFAKVVGFDTQNIRNGPSDNAKVIGSCPKGSMYPLLGYTADGWNQIQHPTLGKAWMWRQSMVDVVIPHVPAKPTRPAVGGNVPITKVSNGQLVRLGNSVLSADGKIMVDFEWFAKTFNIQYDDNADHIVVK